LNSYHFYANIARIIAVLKKLYIHEPKGFFMSKLHKTYFLFLTIQSFQNCTKFYTSERFASQSSVIMNNQEFTHSKKSDNGVQTEQFLINGVPVEKDDYHNQLNTLKLAHMNDQEKETERKADELQAMHSQLKNAVLQKLIKQTLFELNDSLSILEEPILKPYLVYEGKGINSWSDFEEQKAWAAQIQKNLKSILQDQDSLTVQKLAHEVETKIKQVRHCLKQSIQKATLQCDDTATLKKLLTLIE
jgi:hypothetical protein